MVTSLLLLTLCLAPQGDSGCPVPALVEKLASDRIEEREEAILKLKEIGTQAIPNLEQAAKGRDPEIAARAKRLILVIQIQAELTPNVRRTMPGVEECLVQGEKEWTRLFLDATARDEQGRLKFPSLGRPDLDPLAARALRGARSPEERKTLCERLARLPLPAAAPEVLKLALGSDVTLQYAALPLLVKMGYREAIPELAPLLQHRDYSIRGKAAETLGFLGAKEKAAEIAELLKLKEPPPTTERFVSTNVNPWGAWVGAIRAVGRLRYREAIPDVVKFLGGPDAIIRGEAVWTLFLLDARDIAPRLVPLAVDRDVYLSGNARRALRYWGCRELAPEFIKLLASSDHTIRAGALEALRDLEIKDAIPAIEPLLKSEEPYLRALAADVLCRLGSREGVPELLENGSGPANSLNRFRQPEEWERLQRAKLKIDLEGSWKEIEEQWSREAGVALEISPEVEAGRARVPGPHFRRVRSYDGRSSLLEALTDASSISDYILERDRVRIISRREAFDFWRAWAAGKK